MRYGTSLSHNRDSALEVLEKAREGRTLWTTQSVRRLAADLVTVFDELTWTTNRYAEAQAELREAQRQLAKYKRGSVL